MRVKYNGKWLEVARVQYDYNIGKFCYEIYDKPDTDPNHTEWVMLDKKDDLEIMPCAMTTTQGWTTIEESEQLTDAGLDPNTADMCYKYDIIGHKYVLITNQAEKENWSVPYNKNVPCWSLSRLIELTPATIKMGHTDFELHTAFHSTEGWSACYEDWKFENKIKLSAWTRPIDIYMKLIKWLLKNEIKTNKI